MTEHDHGDEDLREADFERDCPMCGESLRPGYSSRERSAHCADKIAVFPLPTAMWDAKIAAVTVAHEEMLVHNHWRCVAQERCLVERQFERLGRRGLSVT